MSKRLILTAPRLLEYETEPDPPLLPDQVRIQTLYSGISAGTELTQYRGTSPFLHKRWDPQQKLFLPADAADLHYPVRTLGYEEVGRVLEVGPEVTDIPVGACVFGTWGHKTQHIAPADYVRPRLMPPDLDPLAGIFSHLGAIALNGVHDAHIRLGDTVAVFGLGALGQIVVQAARQSGARVIGVDLHEARMQAALASGADVVLNARTDNPAESIKALTGGRGADACLEVSGSTQALHEAIRTAAYAGRVVAMGFFQGEAQGLYLGEEFHHNRIQLICSQISGVAPEASYRWDKMRLWQTAIHLQARGILSLTQLITHRAPFEQAAALFELLDRAPQEVLLAVLEFDGS